MCENCFYLTDDDYCGAFGDKYKIDIEINGDCLGEYKKVNKYLNKEYNEMVLSIGQHLKVETDRGNFLLMVIDSYHGKVELINYLHYQYKIDLIKQFIMPNTAPIKKITRITGIQYGKELKKQYTLLYKDKINNMKEYYKGKISNKEIKLKEKKYKKMLKELKQDINKKYLRG